MASPKEIKSAHQLMVALGNEPSSKKKMFRAAEHKDGYSYTMGTQTFELTTNTPVKTIERRIIAFFGINRLDETTWPKPFEQWYAKEHPKTKPPEPIDPEKSWGEKVAAIPAAIPAFRPNDFGYDHNRFTPHKPAHPPFPVAVKPVTTKPTPAKPRDFGNGNGQPVYAPQLGLTKSSATAPKADPAPSPHGNGHAPNTREDAPPGITKLDMTKFTQAAEALVTAYKALTVEARMDINYPPAAITATFNEARKTLLNALYKDAHVRVIPDAMMGALQTYRRLQPDLPEKEKLETVAKILKIGMQPA